MSVKMFQVMSFNILLKIKKRAFIKIFLKNKRPDFMQEPEIFFKKYLVQKYGERTKCLLTDVLV